MPANPWMRLQVESVTQPMQNLDQLEDSLWAAADNLRANSKLTSSEYCMPVLGVIFLRHATNRYDVACRQIANDQASGNMAKRIPIKADFLKRRALMLPKQARYDELLKLPKGTNLGTALVEAMNAIERDFEPLLNQLPKDYDMRLFNSFHSDTQRPVSPHLDSHSFGLRLKPLHQVRVAQMLFNFAKSEARAE